MTMALALAFYATATAQPARPVVKAPEKGALVIVGGGRLVTVILDRSSLNPINFYFN